MKNLTLIPAILLSVISVNALADGEHQTTAKYNCKTITGHIAQLQADSACNIEQEIPGHFPYVTIFEPKNCYVGALTATLGNIPVTGTSYSGVTGYNYTTLTAASVITLKAAAGELGRVFTTDTISYSDGSEILTMVDGSKMFNGGQGVLNIKSSALTDGGSDFTGTICSQN